MMGHETHRHRRRRKRQNRKEHQQQLTTTTTKKLLGSGSRRKAQGQTHRPRMDIAATSGASGLHHLCCVKGESRVTYAEEHTYSRVFFNEK